MLAASGNAQSSSIQGLGPISGVWWEKDNSHKEEKKYKKIQAIWTVDIENICFRVLGSLFLLALEGFYYFFIAHIISEFKFSFYYAHLCETWHTSHFKASALDPSVGWLRTSENKLSSWSLQLVFSDYKQNKWQGGMKNHLF